MGITENYLQLKRELPSSITLVIAGKYASFQQIQELTSAGCLDIGFNTWQQLEEAKALLPTEVRVHFIGTLQSNKVKKVVESGVFLIQSVDSFSLAESIAAAAKEKGMVQNILLQVRTDPAKEHGFLPEEVFSMAVKLQRSPRLKVMGLMTIPAPETNKEAFRLMRKLFEELQKVLGRKELLPYLSMGMSEDYALAVEEGATMVRVGRKVFH